MNSAGLVEKQSYWWPNRVWGDNETKQIWQQTLKGNNEASCATSSIIQIGVPITKFKCWMGCLESFV